jgi:hypothetical protein
MSNVRQDVPVHITDGRLGIFDDAPATASPQSGGRLFNDPFNAVGDQPLAVSAPPMTEMPIVENHLAANAMGPDLSRAVAAATADAAPAFVQDADTLFATSAVAAATASAVMQADSVAAASLTDAPADDAAGPKRKAAVPTRVSKRVRRGMRSDWDDEYAPPANDDDEDDGAGSESPPAKPRVRAKIVRKLDDGTGAHACKHPGCGKTFTKKFNLSAHQRLHNNEQPFQCRKCQKTFRWKSSLSFHELNAHKR